MILKKINIDKSVLYDRPIYSIISFRYIQLVKGQQYFIYHKI